MKSVPLGRVIGFALAMLLPGARLQAISATETSAGREVVKQRGQSVINIAAIVVHQTPAGGREGRLEITGTVIAESGLTVTSLSALDPNIQSSAMRAMLDQGGGPKGRIFESALKEVKLCFSDSPEVVAQIVWKDSERDLAFLAPDQDVSTKKRVFVSTETAPEMAQLDSCYLVSRLPKILETALFVRPVTVAAVLQGPARILIVDDAMAGWPVFSAGGDLVGITVQRIAPGFRTPVVMPTAQIMRAAKQAALALPQRSAQDAPVQVKGPGRNGAKISEIILDSAKARRPFGDAVW